MHTHRSLRFAGTMLNDSVSVPEGTVSLFVLPMCHVYGISCMVAAFFHKQGKAIILPSFTVDKIFEAIQTYTGQLFVGVPTLYVYMLLHPDPTRATISAP